MKKDSAKKANKNLFDLMVSKVDIKIIVGMISIPTYPSDVCLGMIYALS